MYRWAQLPAAPAAPISSAGRTVIREFAQAVTEAADSDDMGELDPPEAAPDAPGQPEQALTHRGRRSRGPRARAATPQPGGVGGPARRGRAGGRGEGGGGFGDHAKQDFDMCIFFWSCKQTMILELLSKHALVELGLLRHVRCPGQE